MKYPFSSETIIDVTKAPYFADNTGKTDCTEVLCRVFDDLLAREREGVEKTKNDLLKLSNNCEKDVFIGFEARTRKGFVNVIFPEVTPPARIIYFPDGEYLVSDTVSYRAKDLYNLYKSKPFYTLTRGIHVLGESRDGTVIRLADNSAGFDKGSKPVLAFTMDERACEIERSNISQLNTCCDLTVDCGRGNPGAVGLRFVANNAGRVENMTFRGESGLAGLELVVSTEGVFRDLLVDGFDIGVYAHSTSMCVFDGLDLRVRECGAKIVKSKTVFRNCTSGSVPFFASEKLVIDTTNLSETERKLNNPSFGGTHCFFGEAENIGAPAEGGKLFIKEEPRNGDIPRYDFALSPEDCALVDDFGAIGDGVTDSTEAIQKALDSGKSCIFFGSGHYLVNGPVFVPASVKLIDFMFCDLFAGDELKAGKHKAFIVIDGESEQPLCMENIYTFEQFCGHFRFIYHKAGRELRMRDLHTQAAALYVGGHHSANVYSDNCVCTTGSYSMSTILSRGTEDDYYTEIPFEFHGQRVLAYNMNPERADLEVLNDGGDVTLYCLKTEGPGTAAKTVNGGITRIYNNSSAIGNAAAKNPLFSDDESSTTLVYGGSAFGLGSDPSQEFRRIYEKAGQPDILRGEGNPYTFDINI